MGSNFLFIAQSQKMWSWGKACGCKWIKHEINGGRERNKSVRKKIPNEEIKVLKQEWSFMVKYVIGGKL